MTFHASIVALAAAGAIDGASPDDRPGPTAIAAPPSASVERPAPADLVVPVLHTVALFAVVRATEAFIWPHPFAEPSTFRWHYERAYTLPPKHDGSQPFMRWDGDPLAVNVVGHALMGSELYLRARQCRLGWLGALGFAAAASTVWEYVVEANGARPSAQDLVYTPLMGLVLGEARYALHRAAGGLRSRPGRAVVRGLVDPFGEIERAAGTDC